MIGLCVIAMKQHFRMSPRVLNLKKYYFVLSHPMFNAMVFFAKEGAIYLNMAIVQKRLWNLSILNLQVVTQSENVMAVIGAAYAAGIGVVAMNNVIRKFSGILHRLRVCQRIGWYQIL